MPQKDVQIRFESEEEWEEKHEEVDKILEELTGTNDYPATMSLPPIIFDISLDEDGIEKLENLGGVIVNVS